jgi:protein SCO1/2
MTWLSLTKRAAAALGIVFAALGSVAAHSGAGPVDPRLDPAKVIETSQAALGRQVGSHILIDSDGRPLPLADYRGRPLVISLVYTSCSSVCPTTTQHLLDAVRQARKALGKDGFAVLTVGFDARHDTPGRLASFADAQGIDGSDWRLASGGEATLAALVQDLGFSYAAAAGGFEHITQTSIIDAQGRVYRHVYGDNFPIQVFIEPLKELVFGTATRALSLTAMVDRLKFLCTVYDPNLGRYKTSYALALGLAVSGLTILATGWMLLGAWRRTIRSEQASAPCRRPTGSRRQRALERTIV